MQRYRWARCCTDATYSIGRSQLPPGMKPNDFAGSRPYSWHTNISLVPTALSTILNMASRQVTGRARFKSFGSGTLSPILIISGASPAKMRLSRRSYLVFHLDSNKQHFFFMRFVGMSCSSDISQISSTVVVPFLHASA